MFKTAHQQIFTTICKVAYCTVFFPNLHTCSINTIFVGKQCHINILKQ